MTYPRQRLYDVNHAGYIWATLTGAINAPVSDDASGSPETHLKQVFRDYTDIPDLIPLSRGRLAVFFAIKHSLTSQRRKVIMSPFTIFDLVNMVRLAGGEPVFVDSEQGGPHISRRRIEQMIDDQTAAVIVTHYHSTNREIADIANLCHNRSVALIEDCAISLGARVAGHHVGTFGDFALFSFGLFKFVSTYFGGGLVVRDAQKRKAIEAEIAEWPRMTARDLFPYAAKGLKLSMLTQKSVFNLFTFPVFRFGYLHNVDVIKKNAQNDPSPILRDQFPDEFTRRPSTFQLREFCRQIPKVEADRAVRLKNAKRYFSNFRERNVGGLPEEPHPEADCYLNFPIFISGDREGFVGEMMKSGFDVATYYYRNCSDVSAFKKYHRELPNISGYVKGVVFFPTYPGVDPLYIDRLTKRASELLS